MASLDGSLKEPLACPLTNLNIHVLMYIHTYIKTYTNCSMLLGMNNVVLEQYVLNAASPTGPLSAVCWKSQKGEETFECL